MPPEPSTDERAASPEPGPARAHGPVAPAAGDRREAVVLRTVANPRRTRL